MPPRPAPQLPLEGTPPELRGLPHVPAIRTLPELHCELRSARTEYALAALNAFVAPKYRFAANHEFVERSLDQAQRAFPEHEQAFSRLRAAYRIRSHLPAPGPSASASSSRITPALHLRDLAEQRAARDELYSRLRGSSQTDAVTALDDFLVDAISDWSPEFAIQSVDDAERMFPDRAEAFAYIRSEWHLPPPDTSMPVTPTGGMVPRSPLLSPASPISPASPAHPLSPMLPSLFGKANQLVGDEPDAGGTEQPPQYAKDDPDPGSTRLLEQRLAAEADYTPAYGLGMTFLIPAPQYGAQHSHSAFALARSTESPSPPALAAPSPHARRATVGFRPDEPDRERDRDRDRRGSLERELGRGRPSTTGARHRSRSDAWGGRPTYTFTAAELAGVGMHRVGSPASGLGMRRGGSGGGDLRSASTGGPVGSGPGPGGMGGVAMSRESSWSGPTYTFTAEQLASAVPSRFREALPAPLPGRASARGVPDISIVTGTSSAGISSSRVHSRVPSRVPSPTREDAIPAPTARLARTPEPPTFTFTAAELAAVGELGERERRASLGVHKWKALLPRRLSAPAEGVPKLSRSLSRGER